jgi:ubiquinone/menaquinone biosynthesis C-methylase UbiE
MVHRFNLVHSPGQATSVLAERFQNVIGVDPSPGMISSAQEQYGGDGRLTFVNAKAEDLSSIEDESVDLVTAGDFTFLTQHRAFGLIDTAY